MQLVKCLLEFYLNSGIMSDKDEQGCVLLEQ
jgi:hypothetical protein